MNITRHNYEEFFLLYADNELSAAEKEEVEAFVQQYPDLKNELAQFLELKITPEPQIVFPEKNSLLKSEPAVETINAGNCEIFFVLYADDELDNAAKAKVEEFVYHHPEYQAGFELLQQVKLQPDNNVVFPDKESLYKTASDEKVVVIRWWQLAAAAILLLIAGLIWLNNNRSIRQQEVAQGNKTEQNKKATIPSITKSSESPAINNKNNIADESQKENIAGNNEKNSGATEKNNKDIITTKEKRNNNPLLAVKKSSESGNDNNIPQKEQEIIASVDPKPKNFTGNIANNNPIEIKGTNLGKEKIVVIDDQPTIGTNSGETDKTISYAVAKDDRVEVLNTSVDKKNSMRGFFRKASRLLSKKTDTDNEKHKSILIGGFEIALK